VLLNKALVREEEAESLEKGGLDGAAEERYDEALAAYEEVLGREPVFPNALFNGGFFFMRRGDFGRALDCFSRYLEQDGVEEEKQEKARTLAEEISRRGLEDSSFREAYEDVREGREEEGMDKIRRFLEQRPLVWNGWFVLGWALRRLGRWEDGATAFRKALELGGDNRDTRNELAICLMEMKDYGAARKELERALREDPDDIKIISNLGVLALKEGREREAAAFFRAVLELNPGDTVARAGLESLGIAG
jgi:tetratricopeptide (TPR) repeat protein